MARALYDFKLRLVNGEKRDFLEIDSFRVHLN